MYHYDLWYKSVRFCNCVAKEKESVDDEIDALHNRHYTFILTDLCLEIIL